MVASPRRVFLLFFCWLLACGEDGGPMSSPLDSSIAPANPCLDGGCGVPAPVDAAAVDARVFVPPRQLKGVRIEPAQVVLMALDGSKPSQLFQLFAQYDDGSEGPVSNATFRVDSPIVGDFVGSTFTANGAIGGVVNATAEVRTTQGVLRATAPLTVSLERTVRIGTLPANAETQFTAAAQATDAARAANVVYPLNGAVVPQNVFPLDVQWTRAAVGDVFRVSWSKPHARVVAYLAYDAQQHWLPELDAWRMLARSDPDMPAQLQVERLEAATGQRIADAPRTLTFARTALTGSIYYWDIEATRIQRIDDGRGAAVSFMPKPPISNDASGCIGCHSVSNSGRYMAGRLGGWDSLGAVFDLTQDLTTNPAPTLWPVQERELYWWFSSWSPDDKRLIVSAQAGPELRLYDPIAGVRVPTSTLPIGTMPDWSPDGKRIAYVSNPDNFGDKMTRGDISILDVTGPDTFGESKVIMLGDALPRGRTVSYPSWTPSGDRIAFAHGTGSRSESQLSELFMMQPDGSAPTPLTNAMSGELDDFQPNFSPFTGDGYYWLTFLSRRIYGNDARGNGSKDISRRQQIWVTAIRANAEPGTDPSAVPFWLPGQNAKSANISASWAARACRDDGSACSVNSECCNGDCRPDASGALVCGPPPPERCLPLYEECTTGAQCCNGNCVDRVCSPAAI